MSMPPRKVVKMVKGFNPPTIFVSLLLLRLPRVLDKADPMTRTEARLVDTRNDCLKKDGLYRMGACHAAIERAVATKQEQADLFDRMLLKPSR